MKGRLFAALALAIASASGLAGCGEETGVKKEVKVETPTGSKTVTQETKVNETGDMKTGGAGAGATTPTP